ncbi:hypothetical protein VHEMI04647 [[Torrubiella] hemipterigena]|uniref:Uncharacterized protein n=1 Tax=[Torrubiella] hemipterigena TaxID=1531966 RepID=A0A0A1TEH7_9HYPO|nr:hypothetical protein VHEMI04647 [[Torrubiella] hemipterigena]
MSNTACRFESLPSEILQLVVDCLVRDSLCANGYVNLPPSFGPSCVDQKYRQTICSLRLTNKAWNEAASHALVPIVRIDLNEASLARAEEIASTPSIAAGVLGVDLVLGYCSEELANDSNAFARLKLDRFDSVCSTCPCCPKYMDRFFEKFPNSILYPGGIGKPEDREDDEEEDEEDPDLEGVNPEDVRQAKDRWELLNAVWDPSPLVENQTRIYDKSAADMLRKGLEQFQTLSQEQRSLVTSGRFANSIGRILSKFPRLNSIVLRDGDAARRDLPTQETIRTMLDDDEVLKIVAEPLPWAFYASRWQGGDVESGYYPQNTVAKLLWDIPIALHRQGVSIRSLSVSSFPCGENFQLGTPEDGFVGGTGAEFRDFMSSLESFDFGYFHGGEHEFFMPPSMPERQKNQVAEYLGACVSSHNLRNLNLHLGNFSPPVDTSEPLYFPLGKILSHVHTNTLFSVSIEYVTCSVLEFRSLISKLTRSTQAVRFEDFEINHGEVDDPKEEVLEAVGGEHNCSVYMSTIPRIRYV